MWLVVGVSRGPCVLCMCFEILKTATWTNLYVILHDSMFEFDVSHEICLLHRVASLFSSIQPPELSIAWQRLHL
jgi:hypothetical protein